MVKLRGPGAVTSHVTRVAAACRLAENLMVTRDQVILSVGSGRPGPEWKQASGCYHNLLGVMIITEARAARKSRSTHSTLTLAAGSQCQAEQARTEPDSQQYQWESCCLAIAQTARATGLPLRSIFE